MLNETNTSLSFFRNFVESLQTLFLYASIIDKNKFVLHSTAGFNISRDDVSKLFDIFENNDLNFSFTFQGESWAFVKEYDDVIVNENKHAYLITYKSAKYLIVGFFDKNGLFS